MFCKVELIDVVTNKREAKSTVHCCVDYEEAIAVHLFHNKIYLYNGRIETNITDETPCDRKDCSNFLNYIRRGTFKG
jgi:hypothetical protein